MAVHLNEHFTFKKLLKATFPSILMMVFTSIYSIVDGLFVSNYVGTSAFSAVNLIYPVVMIIGAIGFMMGAGGSALVSKTLGEGDKERANKIFSMVVYFTVIMGLVISAVVFIFIEDISILLGATPEMLPYCKIYGQILVGAEIAFMIQNLFQNFFIVAEKPMFGFIVTVGAGITNMILDAVFIVVFKWGVAGAAIATVVAQIVGSLVPIIYFSRKNKSLLKLTKTKLEFGVLLKTFTNGSSELLSNISASIVSMIYNKQLLKFAGENGVAAYGVIMYASFIFAAVFIGYSIGTAPIVGYNYGSKNHEELKNIKKKSLFLTATFGVVMTLISMTLAKPLSSIFVSYDKELLDMTTGAMRIYSVSFIFMGVNIFTSSFFTALNDGLTSAIVSFARTLIFQTSAVLLLPLAFGLDGVWAAIIVAESLSLVLDIIFLIAKRKKYNY